MEWRLIDPRDEVEAVVELADRLYGHEADGIVGRDRVVFRKHVTLAAVYQAFDRTREFLAGCWDGERLLGWSLLTGYMAMRRMGLWAGTGWCLESTSPWLRYTRRLIGLGSFLLAAGMGKGYWGIAGLTAGGM